MIAAVEVKFVRAGVAEKFPPIKKFLKSYVLALESWETEDLEKLKRYVNEGRFEYLFESIGEIWRFSLSDAQSCLARVGNALQWYAIQSCLKQEEGWEQLRFRSLAYRYWGIRAEHRFDKFMLQDFQSGGRPQYLPMLRFRSAVSCLAQVFLLGWTDLALELNQWILSALKGGAYFDADEYSHPRAQFFTLKLLSEHFDLEYTVDLAFTYDEPIYNVLSENWRTHDLSALANVLLSGLDRHTHQSRRATRNGPAFDFQFDEDWYFPYEILVVLKLRDMVELKNPTPEELAHPLTATPLGKLTNSVPIYSEGILNGVIQRLREEFPDV